jgi:hypothetical protein
MDGAMARDQDRLARPITADGFTNSIRREAIALSGATDDTAILLS